MAQLVGVVGDQMPDGRRPPRPLAHGSDTSATIEHHQSRSGARERGGHSRWRVPTWRYIGRAGRADALGDAPLAARDRCTGKGPTRSRRRPTGTCIVPVHPGCEQTMVPVREATTPESERAAAGRSPPPTWLRAAARPLAAGHTRRMGDRARAADDRLGQPRLGRAARGRRRPRGTGRPPSTERPGSWARRAFPRSPNAAPHPLRWTGGMPVRAEVGLCHTQPGLVS
jgi:hypothetical protein